MDLDTIQQWRQMIADQTKQAIEGKSTPAALNATVNAAGKIFSSIKLEIEYHKAIGKTPFIPMLNGRTEIEPPKK